MGTPDPKTHSQRSKSPRACASPWLNFCDDSSFRVNKHGTPLDELFGCSETPDEAKTLAAEWLGIVAAKGHDVIAYLKKEKMLHSTEHRMTYVDLSHYDDPRLDLRELQFNFDDAQPCVWWEWWTDPASPTNLLECEFAQMIRLGPPHFRPLLSWETQWPFRY